MKFVSKVENPDYSTESVICKHSPLISNKGLSITWTNLSVAVEQKKSSIFAPSTTTYKEIIHNVNGAVKAGTLVAILGASGSGKSTLMSVLADRNPGGLHVSGNIKIGRQPKGSFIRRISAFVFQDDLFLPSLTVLEHLMFTVKLKLDKNMNEKSRKSLIREILTELGLTTVMYNRIGISQYGNEKMNLSGGERKRLSIATELLTDPSLLFCDEPTTGLDSFTALNVIANLEHLVKEKQKTIICSIHQPNEKIFELFQNIILLSNGKIAFSGSSEEASEFFKSQGYTNSEGLNSADFLVQSLAHIAEIPDGVNNLCASFETTKYYDNITNYIDVENDNEENSDPLLLCQSKYDVPPWFLKLWYATHRSFLIFIRNSAINKMKIINHLLTSSIIALCVGDTISPTQAGMQPLKGVLFLLIAHNFFIVVYAVLNYLPKLMPVFFREYANDVSSPLIFYLSNMFSLFPNCLFEPLFSTVLIYWWISLKPDLLAWCLTCLIITLSYNISAAFGIMLSIVYSFNIADVCVTILGTTFVTCSGFYNNLSSIPSYLGWIRYISWFVYAFESVFIIQIDGIDYIKCDSDSEVPCLSNGSEVLASYGINENNLGFNLTAMFFLYFLFHVLAYVGLLFKIQSRII